MINYLIIGLVYIFLMEILLIHDKNPMNYGERIISLLLWPVFLLLWLKNMFNTFNKK